MVSIDRAQELLDEICQEIPAQFFTYLNGGICLLPDVVRNPLGRADDLYTLGRYIHSRAMGRYIEIFYGSITRIYGHTDEAAIRHQLREVLLHEFTHHIESLAGEQGLEIKDREQINRYLAGK